VKNTNLIFHHETTSFLGLYEKGVIEIRIKNYYPQEHKGVCVVLREGETTEKLIKRFKKRCMKDGLLQEMRERMFYEKPSVKKRKKWRRNQRAREREKERYLRNLEKLRKKRAKQKQELASKVTKRISAENVASSD